MRSIGARKSMGIKEEHRHMTYQERTLTLRKELPLEVFKAIRIRNAYPEKYTAHLIYLRQYSADYNIEHGDILDARILHMVRSRFEDAVMWCSELLLTDQQFETCLDITKGGAEKSVIFYFNPETDYATYVALNEKGLLKSYYLGLRMTFWFDDKDPRIQSVPNEVLVQVPLAELDKLIKTIKRV